MTYSEAQFVGAGSRTSDYSPLWLIAICMSFNAALAFANAQLVPITGTHVQLIQIAITSAGLLLMFLRGGPQVRLAFPLLIVAFLFCYAVSSIATGMLDIKTLYDVLMFSTFIGLGSTMRNISLHFLNAIVALVAVVAAFEYFLPDLYMEMLNPLGYFASTREWVAAAVADSFNDGAGLYLGTIRGSGESWLGISLGGHRVGGIFLEPLSQGYFAVMMSIFYSIKLRDNFRHRAIACLICLGLALVSDTRVAVLMIIFNFLAEPQVRRLPAQAAYAIPPLGLVLGGLAHFAFVMQGDSSEFAYRLSLTFQVLQESPIYNILFGGLDMTYAADSGVVTIMARAGLVGLLIFFLLGSGLASMRTREPTTILLVTTYLFVTSLFGAAFLSIKTAALLGLVIGAVGSGAFGPVVAPGRRT